MSDFCKVCRTVPINVGNLYYCPHLQARSRAKVQSWQQQSEELALVCLAPRLTSYHWTVKDGGRGEREG